MLMGVGTRVNGSIPALRTYEDSRVRRYEIMNPDGTVAGSFTVRKSTQSSKKTKKVQYNFKRISSQILKSKTSGGARKAVASARRQVAQLKRKLKSGEYDDKELEIAIAHAEKIERVAKKRMKHLQEEERAKKGGICEGASEEKDLEQKGNAEDLSKEQREAEEAMRQIMEETIREMEASMEEMQEETAEENGMELMECVNPDMDPKDLEALKRKHRLDEMKDIAEADAKYLKALFSKLEGDKQNVSSAMAIPGVSLELGGAEMTVSMQAAVPVNAGTEVDVSV